MRGIHDLGGRAGFGRVEVEDDEPVFHDGWERRAFGMSAALTVAGHIGGPSSRHAIERMEPGHYLNSSYYEHWFTSAATLVLASGLVEVDELEARAGGHVPLSLPERDVTVDDPGIDHNEPSFAPGDRVSVEDRYFPGHDRCPGYVAGRVGSVVRSVEASNVPEVEAHLGVLRKAPTYVVSFAGRDLWGPDAEAGTTVLVELYEHHLSPA